MDRKTVIGYVEPESYAEEAGLEAGDIILSVNGNDFYDILEYRFLTSESEVVLDVLKKNGDREEITIENDYEDLGIEFENCLIDKPQHCKNKCIFCFIDQLPEGMRETVYFKDDDTRLSFLQGNYVTLTNMSDNDIDRLIKMRISPINISVHTTNPDLRVEMLNNKNAGRIYDIMQKFADNNIIYTYRNDEGNKDVYMVALRDDDGTLIGYYEKHEYRNKETAGLYQPKK